MISVVLSGSSTTGRGYARQENGEQNLKKKKNDF